MSPLIMIAIMMAIFWFLILRPQQKKQKEHANMINSLSKGDRVVTNGGLFASVLNVKDDIVVATISEGVKVELAKSSVSARVNPKKS